MLVSCGYFDTNIIVTTYGSSLDHLFGTCSGRQLIIVSSLREITFWDETAEGSYMSKVTNTFLMFSSLYFHLFKC